MVEVAQQQALRMGYSHLITPIAAHEAMCVALKYGYKVLSKVTYTDQGAPYALPPELY